MDLFMYQLHGRYKVLEGNRTKEGSMAKRLLRHGYDKCEDNIHIMSGKLESVSS